MECATWHLGGMETGDTRKPNRDPAIDGLRACAALGVVVAHAVTYRFASLTFPDIHYLRRIADPLAQTSVQIFFVISGYIITTLLLKEESQQGRFSLASFYIRRACRIIPPLVMLYVGLLVLDTLGVIALNPRSLLFSATFTCNLGVADCEWWVAHTWSLAVEEQFYLCWPLVLMFVRKRTAVIVGAFVAISIAFLIAPLTWHSNFVSFACIAMGAMIASSGRPLNLIRRNANGFVWLLAMALLSFGPLYLPAKPMQAMVPPIIAYVIFAGREIKLVRTVLALRVLQVVGFGSYSLYLWQQVFLARSSAYSTSPPPLWLLPVVVAASVVLVEQPFIRVGRTLSRRVSGGQLRKSQAGGRLPTP